MPMAERADRPVFSVERLLSNDSNDINDCLGGLHPVEQEIQAGGNSGYGATSETREAKPSVRKSSKRRIRTTFTNLQLGYLELQFSTTQYMTGEDRVALARQLGLSEIQVKVWFQNRRIKWRRLQHQITLDNLKHARYSSEHEGPIDSQPTLTTTKNQGSIS